MPDVALNITTGFWGVSWEMHMRVYVKIMVANCMQLCMHLHMSGCVTCVYTCLCPEKESTFSFFLLLLFTYTHTYICISILVYKRWVSVHFQADYGSTVHTVLTFWCWLFVVWKQDRPRISFLGKVSVMPENINNQWSAAWLAVSFWKYISLHGSM